MSIEIKDVRYMVNDTCLLDKITFDINPGEITTILGPNGAGKSTLIKLISGDMKPSSGEILYDKILLNKLTLENKSHRRSVLSQSQNINFDFTVRDIVEMGWINDLNNNFEKILNEVSKECSIVDIIERKFRYLSGGEQKRVHLARTLLHIKSIENIYENKYILLDEPLANLDIFYEFKLIKIIRKLAKNGLGILMILHDINLAYKFSNKIALMLDGKVKYFGNPEKVINQKNLEKIYGLKMKIFTKPFFIKYY